MAVLSTRRVGSSPTYPCKMEILSKNAKGHLGKLCGQCLTETNADRGALPLSETAKGRIWEWQALHENQFQENMRNARNALMIFRGMESAI